MDHMPNPIELEQAEDFHIMKDIEDLDLFTQHQQSVSDVINAIPGGLNALIASALNYENHLIQHTHKAYPVYVWQRIAYEYALYVKSLGGKVTPVLLAQVANLWELVDFLQRMHKNSLSMLVKYGLSNMNKPLGEVPPDMKFG